MEVIVFMFVIVILGRRACAVLSRCLNMFNDLRALSSVYGKGTTIFRLMQAFTYERRLKRLLFIVFSITLNYLYNHLIVRWLITTFVLAFKNNLFRR